MTQTDPNATRTGDIIEELQVVGEQLVAKVRELVREGNVRRIRIKQDERIVLEIPLSIGVVGVLLAPTMAALGAVGALLAQCSIEVVRVDYSTPTYTPPQEPASTPETPQGL